MACPAARAADPGGRHPRRASSTRRPRLRGRAQGGRRGHRHPRLHALPAASGRCSSASIGRDVTLITSAEEIAREVAETLARRGVGNDPDREGDYRFLCTGDPAAFRDVAGRFLQLPADRGRAGRSGRAERWRHDPRRRPRSPTRLRPISIEPGLHHLGVRLGAVRDRLARALICTAMVEESVPPWMRGRGDRVGHVGVRHASRLDRLAQSSATRAAASRTGARSRSSGWSAGRCGRWSISPRSASARSGSTAT